jgi:serine/threonine-protein kinase
MPTTTTCPGCGGLVPLGDRFCGACGTPITGSALMSGEGARFDPWEELLQKLRQATIGEYEIKGELGRGGMAAVLLAHDLQLNRKVAIKVMLPGLVYGASMWDRFLSEARMAAKLDHPNIIYIHSVKEKDRFLYFVMKYIDGRSLDDILLRGEKLPVPVAQTILVDVARALDYAHHEGVVHRDIKPANIMIDQKGNSIVMDFGIARATDEKRFTQTGATIGTPAYMSPEQCRGNETTDASDQYSLGILAYEMLAGAPPFGGTPIELQIAHMQDAPRTLRDLRGELSLELSGAVMRMLSKDPAERWPSLRQLIPIFGRGLDTQDDSPRNYLIALVKEGASRRQAFPATPVSLVPATSGANAAAPTTPTPPPGPLATGGSSGSAPRAVLPESATTPVPIPSERAWTPTPATGAPATPPAGAPATLSPGASEGGSQAGFPLLTPVPEAAGAAPVVEPLEAPSGWQLDAVAATEEAATTPDAALDEPLTAGADTAPKPGRSRRPLALVGTALGVGVLWVVLARGKKPEPPPEPPTPAPAATTTAAAAVEAAIGDSVALGHGPDAVVPVKGKPPRTVTPDAVSLLLISIPKSRVAVGDTVRAKLDVQDDNGLPVTTPQIVWSTSDPHVARFLGPAQLVAMKEGKATITVGVGTVTASRELIVEAAKPAKAKRSPP